MMIRIAVPLALLTFCLGCGSTGPDDPLTGAWSNAVCFGDATRPDDIQSCEVKLRFEADLRFTLTDSRQSLPATAVNPRCNAIRTVTGLTYSTNNSGTLTLSGSSSSTLERRDCANPADNQGSMVDTRDSVAAGASSYSIKDRALSITSGPLRGEYVRQ